MKNRIHSIDIVRGLIMIIMTLDHVRDFLHTPSQPTNMQTTTVVLFFTRWITHFCAPTFVFLSGVSAYLAGQRRSKGELSAFLLKRGLWLVVSDLVFITLLFSFNPKFQFITLEVLAAIGVGMILLAALIRLPVWLIGTIGFVIIFGHNLAETLLPDNPVTGILLKARPAVIPLSSTHTIFELYAFIPWAGPLLLGYAFGQLYANGFNGIKRRKILLLSGLAATLLFIALRYINQYGDPAPWAVQRNAAHTLLSFLNTTKQTPSLLYLLMTLGPVMVLLSLTENISNRFSAICEVFGNVPYAYFIGHMAFIRLINVLLIFIDDIPFKSTGFPLVWQADGFGHPLWQVYLLWLFVLIVLYFPARWYGNYKRGHKQWWLSYL
ncbi:DUF1624 domain-containing protein [Mucilaginibacter pedocola]|uniref:Heparan-alpha-glucosaminide N-acetyltransferase catalytic domain-containing protein n=1 Tax=Mucilaginibacter pedocola TaxID=1792845 RepID=A0A1S9PNT9_9SPHI|nr:heparan-alpha-glucosaminide N-acetyltransferase domain-containing protein [Mucilaginibacter pedocola]OOQ62238.1 hypothetical protein BC343_04125 [Mucilaginibacter pedocola]